MKCKHAEQMLEYAQDALKYEKPWELWGVKTAGSDAPLQILSRHPAWWDDKEYLRLPQKRKVKIVNGIEVPMHETVALEIGQKYYVPDIYSYSSARWGGDDAADLLLLRKGLVYLNKEYAIACARAMLAFTIEERDV